MKRLVWREDAEEPWEEEPALLVPERPEMSARQEEPSGQRGANPQALRIFGCPLLSFFSFSRVTFGSKECEGPGVLSGGTAWLLNVLLDLLLSAWDKGLGEKTDHLLACLSFRHREYALGSFSTTSGLYSSNITTSAKQKLF